MSLGHHALSFLRPNAPCTRLVFRCLIHRVILPRSRLEPYGFLGLQISAYLRPKPKGRVLFHDDSFVGRVLTWPWFFGLFLALWVKLNGRTHRVPESFSANELLRDVVSRARSSQLTWGKALALRTAEAKRGRRLHKYFVGRIVLARTWFCT